MSFQYDVMSEEQAQKAREFPLLPDGIYDFAVIESKFKFSQNGNPMIELKLRIIHEGQEFNVFDNLIATKMMTWKTKHFCETTGLEKEYLAGKFNEHLCGGKRGTCAISSVGARPKNNGKLNPDGTPETWKAKNEIQDYLSSAALLKVSTENPFAPPPAKAQSLPPIDSEPFTDDQIPF